METIVILNALLVGIIIAFPKGPAGFYIIQQSILHGFIKGMLAAIGCMITTLVLSWFIIFFAQININAWIITHQLWFKIIFACASIVFGIRMIIKSRKLEPISTPRKGLRGILVTFIFTIINPIVFVGTSALILKAHSGIYTETILYKSFFIVCIILGSFLWYAASLGLLRFIMRFTKKVCIETVNAIFGVFYIISGIVLIINCFIPISA